MRIGIFGGSFNPPHKMHYNIADDLISNHYIDKVIFVPTGSKYEYKSYNVSDKDRYKMVELMIKKNKNMTISDYEFKNKVVYTYETLLYFQKIYPNDEIYFICGADNLSYLKDWKNGDYILSNYKIIVVNRNNTNLDDVLNDLKKYKNNIILANIELKDISSTYIRENIDIIKTDIIDKDVLEYIIKKGFYNHE